MRVSLGVSRAKEGEEASRQWDADCCGAGVLRQRLCCQTCQAGGRICPASANDGGGQGRPKEQTSLALLAQAMVARARVAGPGHAVVASRASRSQRRRM